MLKTQEDFGIVKKEKKQNRIWENPKQRRLREINPNDDNSITFNLHRYTGYSNKIWSQQEMKEGQGRPWW